MRRYEYLYLKEYFKIKVISHRILTLSVIFDNSYFFSKFAL